MRRFAALVASLLVAGAMAAGPVGAEPSEMCGGAPAKTGTDGASSASVCTPTGAVTIAYKGGTSGYIIADGDSGNADPSDGYIGASDKGVACSGEGDYNYDSDPHDCGQ